MTRKRMGQTYFVWELPTGKANEVLDTFVGCLAVRRALPRRIEAGLEYALGPESDYDSPAPPPPPRQSIASMLAR